MLSHSEDRLLAGITSFQAIKISPVSALVLLAILDGALCWLAGYEFTGFLPSLVVITTMAGISYAYGRSGRSRALSEMAYYAALWLGFTTLGLIFTYLMASPRFPLYDEYFAALDAAIGFEWPRWHAFLANFSFVNLVLGLAYSSAMMQIVGSIIYFSHIGHGERNAELWWTALVSLLITAVLSAFFPALGAFQHFNTDLTKAIYLPHLLAIRDGSMTVFPLQETKGIIAFPSYHTVMAILFSYAFRGKGRMFWLVGLLNILMLLSTPTFGGHYLVDMLSGAAVAGLAIYLVRRGPRLFTLARERKGDTPVLNEPGAI
jgi:membrane-associated phospholipid phosphatase